MEEDRRRKLEAGKEKLEAFKKLKRSANGQHVDPRAHSMGPTGDKSVPAALESAAPVASSHSSFSSPRSTTSASDTQDAEECNNMLSELANIIAIKQDQLQATKDDSFKPDEAFTDPPSSGESSEVEKFHKSFEVYHARVTIDFKKGHSLLNSGQLKEFQVAVSQRDAVIGQLKDSLQTALAHKERLSMDVHQLERTVASLQRQLQQAMQFLDSSSESSPAKLLIACQEQLEGCHETIQLQVSTINALTAEAAERSKELEKSKLELSSTKTQSATEIQSLMKQVQELHQEASTLRAEKNDLEASHGEKLEILRSELEENFGMQLTQMKTELRQLQQQQSSELEKQHTKQIEIINKTHLDELAALRQALKDHNLQQTGKAEEADKLNGEIIVLKDHINQLSNELSKSGTETETWKQEVQRLTEQNVSVNSELLTLRNQVSEMNTLQAELTQLSEKNTSLSSELTSLRTKVSEYEPLRNELQSLKVHNDSLSLELTAVRTQLVETETLKVESLKMTEHNTSLYSELTTWKEQVSQKNSETEKLNLELQRLTRHNDEISSELAILREQRTDFGTAQVKIQKLTEESNNLRVELDSMRIQVSETEALRSQVQHLTQLSDSLTSELSSLQSHLSECSSLNSDLQALKEQLSQSEIEKHQLDELCQEKTKNLSSLSAQYKSLEQEKQVSEEKLNMQLKELKNLSNDNNGAISQLQSKYVTLEKENENLSIKIKTLEGEKENLKMEVSKVRSLQSKCDILQAECAGLLSEKKDSECEVAHLYSQLKHMKRELAGSKKEVQTTDDPVSFGYVNEVDAIEKGTFSPKHLKIEVPTSPGSIIVWIEKCDNLEKELRTAEANIMRLQTQLQNEAVQSKSLSEEKQLIQTKLKELQEKNSSLQKLSGSLSRSKQLISQYEMKIASQQNEKESLNIALSQLAAQLQKSETTYEEKIHALQEKLCDGLNLKSSSFEELILESCAKAKELVVTKESLRGQKEIENSLNNKIKFLTQLSQQQKVDLEAAQDELQASATELSEVWQKLTEKDELLADKEREVSLLKIQTEQLEWKVQAVSRQESTNVQKELQSLLSELSDEVCELKVALTVEKALNEKLMRESPGVNHTELIGKLQKQQRTISEMKTESHVAAWATRLEDQLGEMIEEVTAYSTHQAQLSETQAVTSDLQQTLASQRHQMEQILQGKATLELQLQQEQNSLHGAKLQVQMLEAQLEEKNVKFEALVEQKERVERELEAVIKSLQSKEHVKQEMKLRLESEVRHRDLQIKQLTTELRHKQVISQVSQSNQMPMEDTPSSEESSRLQEMLVALEEVHSAAVARLKDHLSEQLSVRETEWSENLTKQVAELQQEHANQVSELQHELKMKEETCRANVHVEILSQLGLDCTDLSQAGEQIQEKLQQDLLVLTQDQAIPEDVMDSMKLKFQQLAQKQVLLAVARVKEEQEASFVRQLSSQTTVYKEELAAVTAKLDHQKQLELLRVRQELAELKRTHTETARQPRASELVASLMKNDKEMHNRNILEHLTRTTQHQFTSAISSLARRWSTRCQEMVNQLTKQLETCSDLTNAEDLVKVKVQLLEGVSKLRLDLAQAHSKEVDSLREELTKSHSTLESTATQNDENGALTQQVAMLREALLEQHRELERLRIVIAEFEKNTRGIDDIMRLKDEKHKLEMDDLRTYFQQKCADLEKEYTEKVISQHSRNSSSCSEGELHSTEMTCADTEHSSRLVNITRRCETFSDNSSLRDSDGHNTSDLEHRLVSQEVEMERVRSETVHHYEAEIARLKLQHENHIRDLARDLQSGSEQELEALREGHRNEVQRLQSVHEEVIRNLEKSHLDVVEQLRAELYKAQSSGSQESKAMDNERFEAAVNEKLREHTQALATEVDKMTTAIKEDAEREQARLVDAHQQTLATLVAQHQAQLETMRTRLAANNADVVAQLRTLHEDELRVAEERYRRNIETQAVFIRDEAVREHQRKSAALMEELAAAHRSELLAMESRLTQAHQQEVTRVCSSLEAKLAMQMSDHSRDVAALRESYERRLHEQVEQARHDVVSTLGEQIQAVLVAEEGCPAAESLPAELRTLQERLVGDTKLQLEDTKRQLDETRVHHEEEVTRMRQEFERELEQARKQETKEQAANSAELREESRLLRTLVSELLLYFLAIEEELNALVEGLPLSDAESTMSSPKEKTPPRRVHFAPDVKKVASLIDEDSFSSSSVDSVRTELEQCLSRARREMGAMLKCNDVTNIVRALQHSLDPQLEARLVTSEQRLREVENELQEARDRLTEHESRRAQRETVSEGYGEGVDHPGLEERLERLSEVQDRARSLLADATGEEANPRHLLCLIEELCHEGDRLAEEARRDKEDLQLQLEAADKQLRSTRGFLDEQAAERETERDEFGREVQRLQEALGARDRDRLESERLTKELVRAPHVPLADTDRGKNTDMNQQSPEPHVESLETQVKETTQHLQVSDSKLEELNAELKAAQDKVSVLRDVIHNLEVQLDSKTKSENELRKLLTSLQGALDQTNDELSCQDSCLNDTGLTEQIADLEDQIKFYSLQIEQMKRAQPSVKDLKSQIRVMETTLDKRTRELERLHASNLSTCSSPSEDVSARGGDLESPRVPPVQQSPERPPSPLSLRRLQERLAANGRAEEAACKRVRDLEMQLQTARTAEEEMHMERQMLQQRVEEQLLQISALQAALDQQRLAQSAIDARDAAATRRKLQNAAEQLDQAKDQLQAKENEIQELRTQLENTRKSITIQEESMNRQTQQFQKEFDELHAQLDEVRQEKDALEVMVGEQSRRRNSHLLDSLLAEKNSEIDELGHQVSTLREKLEHVSLRMAGDTPTREDIQELLQEVRSAHSDLRSHYSAVQSTLHSSHMGETDGMRKAHMNGSLDFPRPMDDVEPHIFDGPMTPKGFEDHIPMPQQIQRDLEHSPLLPPAPPGHSSKEFGDMESELLSTRMALAQKDTEIMQAKADMQEHSSKQQAEIARLKDDNNQLREELIAQSGRMEEYVQLMQSEMERSTELEKMQGEEGTSSETESLQHLIARVHKSGFDVLSASEKCLLYHRTRALLQSASQSVATQTSRSGLAETKQLLDLQQQLVDTHQDAKINSTKLLDKVESLEAALTQERIWVSEARRAQDEAESSLAAERRALEEARRARAEAEAGLAAERQSADEARQAHAAQTEELKTLSEKAEEVQKQVERQDRMLQMFRLELEKEEMRVATLESNLAAEHLAGLKLRARLEVESARHRQSQARNLSLAEAMEKQVARSQEAESALKRALEHEESLKRSLQEQLDALQKDKDIDAHNREVKASLEREQQRCAELLSTLAAEREHAAAELKQCEEREQRLAATELLVEREAVAAGRLALEQAQAELQEVKSAVSAEREEKNRLTRRIQELEDQASQARETARMEGGRALQEKTDHERTRLALESSLALLQDRKTSAEQEVETLRQQLAELTSKWERFRHRDLALGDLFKGSSEHASNGVGQDRLQTVVLELQEDLKKCRASLELQVRRLQAEQRAMASERAQLAAQLRSAQNEAMMAKTLLTTERSAWIIERQRMNDTTSRSVSPHSEICEQQMESKIQYLFGKCQRTESWRKNLVWQKRYLLILLRSSQATEDRMKAKLVELSNPKHAQHLVAAPSKPSPFRRFKVAALTTLAVFRIKNIMLQHQRAYSVGSNAIMLRVANALLMSPEPRLEPPMQSVNGTSDASGFSPPTRDETNSTEEHLSPNRYVYNSTPLLRPAMNQYYMRSEVLQHRLGLLKTPTKPV